MGWMAIATHRETLGTRAGLVLQSQTLGTSSCFKWNMLIFGTDGHLMKHVLIMVVAIGKIRISAAAIWLIPTRKHNHNFAITATTETVGSGNILPELTLPLRGSMDTQTETREATIGISVMDGILQGGNL